MTLASQLAQPCLNMRRKIKASFPRDNNIMLLGFLFVGLRKVTNEMKTHKNPALRGSSVVKASDVKPAAKTTPKYGAAAAVKKPPKLELQNKKWIVVSILVIFQ